MKQLTQYLAATSECCLGYEVLVYFPPQRRIYEPAKHMMELLQE